MYLSAPLNKRGENAPRRQRNVSGLFISTFDKYRQLSLEYADDAPGGGTRRGRGGRGNEDAEDGRRNVHAAGVAFATEALEDESEGFPPVERSRGRVSRERSEGRALLSASSNIPGATPVSRPREGHGRRFCCLNAINDLIPVITVLMYRALASERGVERLSLS